jgi:hypothetical protein
MRRAFYYLCKIFFHDKVKMFDCEVELNLTVKHYTSIWEHYIYHISQISRVGEP